jgi:hypothetical protein
MKPNPFFDKEHPYKLVLVDDYFIHQPCEEETGEVNETLLKGLVLF